jgi:hypothetical protein
MTSQAPSLPEPESEAVPSLASRLRRPETILSIVIPLALIALVSRLFLNIKFADLVNSLSHAYLPAIVAAIIVFYAGFPLRGARWRILLQEAGVPMGRLEATLILFVSWFVNVVAPAKLGDIYRGYLTRQRHHTSMTKVLGTVVIERILDIVAVALLSVAAALLTFANAKALSPEARSAILVLVVVGMVLLAVIVVGLLVMRHGSQHIERLLPDRLSHLVGVFKEGLFSVRGRHLPTLIALTGGAWLTEITRFSLVLVALGLFGQLSLPAVVFVAMSASLLTVIPFTPGGLGVVEGGVVAILTIVFGFSPTDAAAVVLLDRAISTYSLVPTGALVSFFLARFHRSPKQRDIAQAKSEAGVPPSIAAVVPVAVASKRP